MNTFVTRVGIMTMNMWEFGHTYRGVSDYR